MSKSEPKNDYLFMTIFLGLVIIPGIIFMTIGIPGSEVSTKADDEVPTVLTDLSVNDIPYREGKTLEESIVRIQVPASKLTIDSTTPVVDSGTVDQVRNHLGDRPLAEYSELIASSCSLYGMDPYWFCTIAITESGGGQHCFLPYNAWGYGQYSWSSWEESIPSFIQHFVQGYGSGLDASSHLTYCPGGAYGRYV